MESPAVASEPPTPRTGAPPPPESDDGSSFIARIGASGSAGQWYSLERVKRAVLDSGGHRLGVLSAGSQFGVYLVGQCIGEGGMARVYQAEHGGLRRQVALKVLIDGFARHADGRERFLREARIAAAVKHPNVVNIFDVGVHEDIPYLVMELLEGQDLERLLATRGALPEALIVDIMVPVVAGLIAVHDAGIVHRDLKPGNIFLARGRYYDLEPKLLDFGISKAPGTDLLKLTTSRTVMGTPLYVSPEGLRGGEMTPASDQYSLGVVMYECATGRTPFPATNFPELSNLIAAGRFTAVSEYKPQISRRMAGIIERAMSLDPERRYRDLRELGRELLQLAGQRTKITWGLSFGEKHTLSSTPPAHTIDQRPSSPAPLPRTAKAVALSALVVFGLAQVFLLGAGVSAWLSGRFSLAEGTRALFGVSRPEPPRSSAAGRAGGEAGGRPAPFAAPAAAEVLRAPAPVATALAAPAPLERVIAPAEGEKPGAPRREARSAAPSPVSAPSAVAAVPPAPAESAPPLHPATSASATSASATSIPTAPERRRGAGAAGEAEPEWALPAASVPATAPRVPEGVGANGAPILD